MLSSGILSYFEKLLSQKIISSTPLSGGDINEVYLIKTNEEDLVVKYNNVSKYPKMFATEAKGLNVLRQSKSFTIPKVIHFGAFEDKAFLILSFIKGGKKEADFWEIFGEKLSALHAQRQPYFGLEHDNYIGSLPQKNQKCDSSYEFYITQRLQPQFQLATAKGYPFSNLDLFYNTIKDEIPGEPSSLIHGDLWSGNFIVDNNGLPCLIDPAIAYASREMDIAMMYLFGGFDAQLFDVYNEMFPLCTGWKKRLSIWQLYYLLVHLNLFGSSYYNRVKTIVDAYK